MTAIVGILCSDGIVIGADSSATFSMGAKLLTIEQPINKLHVIGDRIIVAGTGAVGLDQRFCAIVESLSSTGTFRYDSNNPKKTHLDIAKQICKSAIQDMGETFLKPGQYGALVAFPFSKSFYFYEFQINDFQPELKTKDLWYCSMGSTQYMTDPFLALLRDVFWQNDPPNIASGIFGVAWTLDHAIGLNVGGVKGPIKVAVLGPDTQSELKARILTEEDLGQHNQNIYGIKQHLRNYKLNQSESIESLPEAPKPMQK